MTSRYGQITMSKSIMQDLAPSRASLFLVLAMLVSLAAYPVQAQNVIANKRDVPEVVRRPILPNETFYDSLISAYHNNPQLQAQRARLREIDEGYIQARAQGRLTSRIDGEFRREILRTPNIAGGPDNPAAILLGGGTIDGAPYQAQLSAIQPIYQGGRVRALKQQAKSDILAARERLRATENAIFLQAANAYLNIIRDEEIGKIRRNNVRVLTRQFMAAKERFDLGVGTLTDVAQSESRMAQSEAALAQADAALQISRSQYRRIIGRAPNRLVDVPKVEIPQALQSAQALALDNNPDIIAAYFDEASARAAIDVAKSDGRINLSLNGTVGGNRNQTIGVPRADQASIAAQIVVPIFSGGANQSRIRQAKHAKSRLAFTTRDVRWNVENMINQAWAQIEAAKIGLKASMRQEASAKIAFEGVRLEQEVGTRTQLDVLDAEQEALNAYLSVTQARHDLYSAQFQLLAAMGVFDSQGLSLAIDNPYDPSENFKAVSYEGLKEFTDAFVPELAQKIGDESAQQIRSGVRGVEGFVTDRFEPRAEIIDSGAIGPKTTDKVENRAQNDLAIVTNIVSGAGRAAKSGVDYITFQDPDYDARLGDDTNIIEIDPIKPVSVPPKRD